MRPELEVEVERVNALALDLGVSPPQCLTYGKDGKVRVVADQQRLSAFTQAFYESLSG